jgi:hypothetical protein
LRIILALICALVVFVLTYAAAWTCMRNEMASDANMRTNIDFQRLRDWLATYHLTHSKYPDSFEDLISSVDDFKDRRHEPITRDSFREFFDIWGSRIQYKRLNETYELRSFGRDGKPGGVGFDADLFADPSHLPVLRPSFSQFLAQLPGSGALFRVALISSVCAAAIAFATTKSRTGTPLSTSRLWANCAAVTVSASIVAAFLAFVYIIASESHH